MKATVIIDRVGAWRYAILLALCLVLFLPGQTALPPVDRDEARFAQASKQMLENANFVDIHFQDQPRYKKPIAIYWLQSFTARATNSVNAIAAYRIPSWIGATAAVLLTLWAGTLLFDTTTGLLGGAILASTLLLNVEARLATTDGMLLACIVGVQGFLALAYMRRDTVWQAVIWQWITIWILLGVGILIKGPVILLVGGLTAAVLSAKERSWRWLAPLRPVPGFLLTLVIVSPWLIAISQESDGLFWRESLGQDLWAKVTAGRESHFAPPGTYSVIFWGIWWPASILVVLGLPWAWRHRMQSSVFFCLAWAVPLWLLFELIPTKLPHYVLPAFPPLALLAAKAWLAKAAPGYHYTRTAKGIWLLSALGIPITLGIVIFYLNPSLSPGPLGLLTTVPIAVLWFLYQPYRLRGMLGLMAGAWIFYLAAFQWLLPATDTLWISHQAVKAMKNSNVGACVHYRLLSAGYTEPSLVFIAGTDTILIDGEPINAVEKIADFLNIDSCRMAILTAPYKQALSNAGVPLHQLTTIQGINYSKGKRVTLFLVNVKI